MTMQDALAVGRMGREAGQDYAAFLAAKHRRTPPGVDNLTRLEEELSRPRLFGEAS